MPSWGRGYVNYGAHERPIVGDTKTSAVNNDHLGWLKCDGRLLNPSEFQDLFKVIGFSFGQAGPLFRIPDPAGRVLGYAGSPNDANPSLTTRTMGGLSGEETHQLTIPEMPGHNHGTDVSGGDGGVGNELTGAAGGHTHGITDPTHTHSYSTYSSSNNGYIASTENDGILGGTQTLNTSGASTNITINSVADHQHSISTQGADVPHNNIQPTVWIGNLYIYSGKTGFNRSGTYSGAFPNTVNTNLY